MTESEVVGLGKRRSRREINRLVVEFESSGLRQSEFCHKHGLALGTLQRGLKRRRREVGGQSEDNPLVEVKVARTKAGRSGPETCALEVVLAKGRRIEVRRDTVDELISIGRQDIESRRWPGCRNCPNDTSWALRGKKK